MCLDSISDKPKHTPKEKGHNVGYKIFVRSCNTGKLYTLFQGQSEKSFPIRRWIDEEDWRGVQQIDKILSNSNSLYKTGFHLYYSKKDAEEFRDRTSPPSSRNVEFIVRRVYFKKAVVFGKQDGCSTIVAKEILILKKGE